MKTLAAVLAVTGTFFALAAGVYWLSSGEQAGAVLLAACAPAVWLVAAWAAGSARRSAGLPEDRRDAVPADGAGDVGYFPSSSVWPLVLATGLVVTVNALVFGVWLAVTGAGLITLAAVGYAVEASSKA